MSWRFRRPRLKISKNVSSSANRENKSNSITLLTQKISLLFSCLYDVCSLYLMKNSHYYVTKIALKVQKTLQKGKHHHCLPDFWIMKTSFLILTALICVVNASYVPILKKSNQKLMSTKMDDELELEQRTWLVIGMYLTDILIPKSFISDQSYADAVLQKYNGL